MTHTLLKYYLMYSTLLLMMSGTILTLIIGCRVTEETNPVDYKVNYLFQIGDTYIKDGTESEYIYQSEHIFALISSMATDEMNNLYILDSHFMDIRIYDISGNFVRSINLNKGRGPGEFITPRELYIDGNRNIYITDLRGQKLVILDTEGKFKKEFSVPFVPARVAVCGENIFITGFWLSYDGELVYRYTKAGELVGKFIERPDDWQTIALSGNFDHIAISQRETLIYSFPYPYQLAEYSFTGELIRISSGPVKFSGIEIDEEVVKMIDGSRGLTILPNGDILNVIQQNNTINRIDVFSEDLVFIGSIYAEDFGIKSIRYITSDNDGNIYLDALEPTPHIKKFELTIK